ncbi:MAG TPA: DUF2911 domain-containing protein [Phnomibacter sp.]|nr:DUF2911 domain-containing protein [Phnomibacter sp.]
MIKKILLPVCLLLACIMAEAQNSDEVCYNPNLVKDTTRRSIKSRAVGTIGSDSVIINYHSPGVRNRVIWGGLVPYDEVWVTGAHDATTLEVPRSFRVNGTVLPAGKYAFFTIPGKKEWTLIINKHWQQHLASEYDEKDDLVRVKVRPAKNAHTERLQYFIGTTKGKKGAISMAWEKVKVTLEVEMLE